ncbi:hypothetical protein [Streptomyces sp. NPDC094472]|uniref:hypothetical protein n=1 Tax=unclassified Streptomyces TaxID=2593676 RepID=UPI00331CAF1E
MDGPPWLVVVGDDVGRAAVAGGGVEEPQVLASGRSQMDTPAPERQLTVSVPLEVILSPQIIMGVTKPLVEAVINSQRP